MLTSAVVSSLLLSYFQLLTAFTAESMSSGCPPSGFTAFTDPSGAIVTCNFTVPEMFMRRASSGYTGSVLVLTARVLSAANVGDRAIEKRSKLASERNICPVENLTRYLPVGKIVLALVSPGTIHIARKSDRTQQNSSNSA